MQKRDEPLGAPELCRVVQQSYLHHILGDGSASSSGPACARGTVLGCSEEARLCLRAPFSLKTRVHTGQSHWDPLANISGLGTLWVLQREASGLSLDGDEVALAAAEPACGGQEAPTSSGT